MLQMSADSYASSTDPVTPARSNCAQPEPIPVAFRRSPRIAENLLAGGTPSKPISSKSKRNLKIGDVQDHDLQSQSNKKTKVEYQQYSHLHSRCGDYAYVRVSPRIGTMLNLSPRSSHHYKYVAFLLVAVDCLLHYASQILVLKCCVCNSRFMLETLFQR